MIRTYEELTANLQAMYANDQHLARRTWAGREPFEEYYQSKRLLAQKLNLPEKELVEYLW